MDGSATGSRERGSSSGVKILRMCHKEQRIAHMLPRRKD